MKRTWILSLIPAVMVALTACAPRLNAPVVEVPERYRYADNVAAHSVVVTQRWWELFGDTTLNWLVERALQNNRDLQIATSRIEQAREALRITRAAYLPAIGGEVSAEATYNREQRIVQDYAVEPTLSWEISLFGALRHSTVAARAEVAALVWNRHGVALSLAAEVATNYFTLLQYERDLAIATRTAHLRRESAALIDSMYRYGMSSGIDREQAYSLVYTAEADIPNYRNAIERQPEELSAGVPSELLQRRPDIMQAYHTLQQAAAEAGVARSSRFPSIRLTASAGIGASTLKGLTEHNPAIWSAAGTIVQPIFQAGALRAKERAAVEQYNQVAYQYEQTVLAAFSDVEQALTRIVANREEVERYTRLVDSYREIVTMAHALYRNGMVDYLDVIDAERTLYGAQMQLVNLVTQQYINYVSLCKALGGGWQAAADENTYLLR